MKEREFQLLPKSREERSVLVQKRIEWLIEQTSQFQYRETNRESLESGRFRKLEKITYEGMRDGKIQESDRELLVDRDGSYVLAITPDEQVVFLLQVRAGASEPFQVEFPAGGLRENEWPATNALNELMEEAGGETEEKFIELGRGPVLIGRSPQQTHFFLANEVNVDPGQQKLEKGELIIPFMVPIDEALLLASTLLKGSEKTEEAGLGIDPKIISALTLAAGYYADQGNTTMVQKILSV